MQSQLSSTPGLQAKYIFPSHIAFVLCLVSNVVRLDWHPADLRKNYFSLRFTASQATKDCPRASLSEKDTSCQSWSFKLLS